MQGNILNDIIFKEIETNRYKFYQNTSGDKIIVFKKTFDREKEFSIGDSFNYINNYASSIENISVESILIFGLGSGLLPHYLSKSCKEINVVEIDKELIDIIKWQNYLQSNVNIIEGDVFTFQPKEKKWDYIIVDCFNGQESDIQTKANICIKKYINNINNNGFIYVPWTQQILSYNKLWQV